VAISDRNNYFELDIDRKNKTFVSNAIIGGLPYACMYNVIMQMGQKINKRLHSKEYQVTMESIANDCKVTERFLSGDFGLTINEALLWFQRYNISFSCYDVFWKQIFHWQNNGKVNKHNLEACGVLIHNGHAYYLSENAKKSLTLRNKKDFEIEELRKPSENYQIKEKPNETKETKKIEKKKADVAKKEAEPLRKELFKKCTTIESIFEAIFSLEENENVHIYCIVENLMDIVKQMIFSYGITPTIKGKLGQVKSIELILVNNLIRIYTIHNQMIPQDVLENLTIDEYMLYCKEREMLTDIIIDNAYKSTYNENTKKAFKHYSRGNLRGLCSGVTEKGIDEMLYGIDTCKSYASILDKGIEYIPVISVFDNFTPYTGANPVNPYYFYIVRKVDDFAGSECIFDSDEILTTGNTVIYLSEMLKVNIEIVAELKVCK
jgi:hypothetical protein